MTQFFSGKEYVLKLLIQSNGFNTHTIQCSYDNCVPQLTTTIQFNYTLNKMLNSQNICHLRFSFLLFF